MDLNNQETISPLKILIGVVSAIIFIWFFYGGGIDQQVDVQMNDINQQVASDAVTQYEIAKRGGNRVDICVQAGMVSAAYLQAKDERNYQQWKQIENKDCAYMNTP